MPPSLKNIAIAGASGNVGSIIFHALAKSPDFQVRVLRHHGSKSTFPPGTDVVDVNYSSIEALTAALADQDALVSAVGMAALAKQTFLIDAAIAAGVKRFIPSDFGSNLDNPNVQKSPLFAPKAEIHSYMIEKSKTTDLSYTFIYTGILMDWDFEHSISLNLVSDKPEIVNGGDIPFSGIMISTAGDAVLGVLANPDTTKNLSLFVEDFTMTQNRLFELAEQANPEKNWQPVHVRLEDLEAVARVRLSQGLLDLETFRPYIFQAHMDPAYGGEFSKVDNELVGITRKTEADLLEFMQRLDK